TLLQAQGGYRTRFVPAITLQFDHRRPISVPLDARSHTEPGQTITFPRQRFSTVQLKITETASTPQAAEVGVSGAGFAEISIPGLRFDEKIRVPTDLTQTLGAASLDHRLAYVFTRERSNPAEI